VEAGKLERALDLVDRLHLEKSYDLAMAIADHSDELVDRVEDRKNRRFGGDLSDEPEYTTAGGYHHDDDGGGDEYDSQRITPDSSSARKRSMAEFGDDDGGGGPIVRRRKAEAFAS